MALEPSLRRVARGTAGLAGVTGAVGFLSLMGAFGPISCVHRSVSSDGAGTTTGSCVAGIDYLLGTTGGNAPVLFFWAVALAVLVTLGGAAAWTGRGFVTWLTAIAGAVVSIVGIMSIGSYFVLPTLFLLVAAISLTADALRGADGGRSAAT